MSKLNYTIGEKGFPAFVHHKIEELDQDQLKELVKLVLTYAVVVFRDQNLDADQQIEVCERIGELANQTANKPATSSYRSVISYITGRNDKYGITGSFPWKRPVEWHSDGAAYPKRKPLHWLYAVEGSEGSGTSWINMFAVYCQLPDEYKYKLKDKKVYYHYPTWKTILGGHIDLYVNKDYAFNLCFTNRFGIKSIYFPFNQANSMKDTPDDEFVDIKKYLIDFLMKDEFIYHHDWQDNDLVISDQWASLHRRHYFEHIDKRMMYNIVLDYSNLFNKEK